MQHHSILPDLSRFEAAKVGVLLFCFCPSSGFLKGLTTGHNRRIIKFFGQHGHDWKRIRAFTRGIEDRLNNEQSTIRTIEQLRQFIATRATLIQITQPRPIKVVDPEKDLSELFEQLMGEPLPSKPRPSLTKELRAKFIQAGLQKKIVPNVEVHVEVRNNKVVAMPFGFQNGRLNLIKPVPFETTDLDRAFLTASSYAVMGRSLYEHPDPNRGKMQLLVVGRFRTKETCSTVRHIFEENRARLVPMEALPQLIDEIARTAKEIDGSLAPI